MKRRVRLLSGKSPGKADTFRFHQWGGVRIVERERQYRQANPTGVPPSTFMVKLYRLGFKSYAEYLRSAHWSELRSRYWKSSLRKACFICESRGGLQLHHVRYDNLGHEYLTDLVPLCDGCHERVHQTERSGIRLDRAHLELRSEQSA